MIPQYEPYIKEEYADKIRDQVLSGWVGPGKKVVEFENLFAKIVGSKYAIATSSGSASLFVSLHALGIKPGDEVIVSDYSFIAAVNVIRFMGAIPILVDINILTMCIDPTLLDKAYSEKTKALIFINHNGYVGDDLVQTRIWCSEMKIPMIEDAATAVAQWDTSMVHAGTRGNLGCFSFSGQKFITTGQGGMVVTNDEELMVKVRELVDQGSTTWREDGFHLNVGLNFKLSDIAACYGICQLENLEELCEKRYVNYKRYLSNGIRLIDFKQGKPTGPWMNIIYRSNWAEVKEALTVEGYEAKQMYRPAHHSLEHPKLICRRGSDSVIGEYWRKYLYLPSSLKLQEKDIDNISEIILKHN